MAIPMVAVTFPAAVGHDRPLRNPLKRCSLWMVRTTAAFVVVMLLGNLAIFGAHVWLRRGTHAEATTAERVIKNFTQVDDQVWRGAAPSKEGYEALAAQGITTVVDLRAERGIHVDEELLAGLGIQRFSLPLRDGQAPSAALVQRFLDIAEASTGQVYVHCGAGVGRTGTMAAAYLVHTGQTNGLGAVRRNLAVGPPSLEQVVFGLRMRADAPPRPAPKAVVAVSRVLDAPRRLLVNVRGSYKR